MINRSVILHFLLVVTCAPTLTVAGAEASASRPNIVFLFSDDQTAQAIGCSGNPDVVAGYGYEHYPTLFDRTTPWDQKATHLKSPKSKANGDGEAPKGNNKRKKLDTSR